MLEQIVLIISHRLSTQLEVMPVYTPVIIFGTSKEST